jgi:hypothetical protein
MLLGGENSPNGQLASSAFFRLDCAPQPWDHQPGGVLMSAKPGMSLFSAWWVVLFLALSTIGCASMSGRQADATFTAVEKDGVKMWDGGGTIDRSRDSKPLTLKVVNNLAAEHGFAIDTMRVKEVIKAGEERIITVPLENVDKSVSEHRVYCHLHPKHGPATLKVSWK